MDWWSHDLEWEWIFFGFLPKEVRERAVVWDFHPASCSQLIGMRVPYRAIHWPVRPPPLLCFRGFCAKSESLPKVLVDSYGSRHGSARALRHSSPRAKQFFFLFFSFLYNTHLKKAGIKKKTNEIDSTLYFLYMLPSLFQILWGDTFNSFFASVWRRLLKENHAIKQPTHTTFTRKMVQDFIVNSL